MKILFFGDIVGKIGRQAILKVLPELKKKYQPDLVLANCENLAHGLGVTEKTLKEMIAAGIDFFTSGNHIFAKPEVLAIFEKKEIPLLRPANYPPGLPGEGAKIIEVGARKILIINLVGRVFFKENFDCPFRKIDEILAFNKNKKFAAIIVDFHAEATSEKTAFGWYAAGRVAAVLGTHTHIPTTDVKILPEGTAFVSDIGMVGAKNSVIGCQKEEVIRSFLTQLPFNLEIPEAGEVIVNSVFLEIDNKTGQARKIERVDREVEV